jgi:glutamyl-tRNA(Gln) amidotransferase subunit E
VISTLDQAPILLHSDAWPDYSGSAEELNKMRKTLRCQPNDALVVVWGADQDTVTAAHEIRLRYADAVEGVPLETRQALEDGHTTFERILPGPDRMYPDTDSPPQRIDSARIEVLRKSLSERPWSREERYSAAGVPIETTHFLIRRGGANLVDRLVERCGADLKRASQFVGEELKGLRRLGIEVDEISEERWKELFRMVSENPVLWDARRSLVESMAARPDKTLPALVEEMGPIPDGWRKDIETGVNKVTHIEDGAQRQRFLMGQMMTNLRGLVPATEVAEEIRTWIDRATP